MKKEKKYPESKAVKTWRVKNIIFSIVHHSHLGHYCGYVRFPKKILREKGYDGIVTYVPVHGGITYVEQSEDGSIVYGFDCAHSGDKKNPYCKDLEWLTKECARMAIALETAKKYEGRYLRCITNKGKAKAIDNYHNELRKNRIFFSLQNNFGAMLNVLGGKL